MKRYTDVRFANITTGRGLAESVGRRIAELDDDAKHRDRIAETKRRRIVELTGLQGRAFTHADELAQDRQRLEAVKLELEKSSNASATAAMVTAGMRRRRSMQETTMPAPFPPIDGHEVQRMNLGFSFHVHA